MRKIITLVGAILLCELAGIVGSLFTFQAIPTWYASLNKPSFNPPNWLFGPVWTMLYALMGISLYLVWEKGIKSKESRMAVYIFGVQLFLNAIWSIIFFGMKSPGLGFAVIIALWVSIMLTIIKFYKISRTAAFLLLPYIAWVSFASALNFFTWQLN